MKSYFKNVSTYFDYFLRNLNFENLAKALFINLKNHPYA